MPCKTKPLPIYKAALAPIPILANGVAPAATPFAVKDPKVNGENANAPKIKAAPNKIRPNPLP